MPRTTTSQSGEGPLAGRRTRRPATSGVAALLLVIGLFVFTASTWAHDEEPPHNPSASAAGSISWWGMADEATREAYLHGLLDMLQLERTWQGEKPLAFKRSLAPAWCAALDGIKHQEIGRALTLYSSTYPELGGMPVLYALWEIYVLPSAVSEKSDKAASR